MSQFGKRQLQKPSSPSAAAFSARSSSFRASSTSLLDAHLPPLCLNQFLFFSGMSSMNLFLPFALIAPMPGYRGPAREIQDPRPPTVTPNPTARKEKVLATLAAPQSPAAGATTPRHC